MTNPKEVLRASYEKILMDKINERGGHAEEPNDIWLNLRYLASSYINYGEEKLVMPLQTKKILAYILDPDYRIEYDVVKTEKDCTVTASFYWGGSETPAGSGFVKRYINQIFPNDGLSYEERDSIFEPTVRGMAATRAITDAGIAMQFYADSLDMFEPEMTEKNAKEADKASTPPEVMSNNKKKEVALKRASNKNSNDTPAQVVSAAASVNSSNRNAENLNEPSDEMISRPREIMGDLSELFASPSPTGEPVKASDQENVPEPETNRPSAAELDWARSITINIGKFQGELLGKLMDCDKLNGVIWLSKNASGDVKKAANILVRSDSRFNNLF